MNTYSGKYPEATLYTMLKDTPTVVSLTDCPQIFLIGQPISINPLLRPVSIIQIQPRISQTSFRRHVIRLLQPGLRSSNQIILCSSAASFFPVEVDEGELLMETLGYLSKPRAFGGVAQVFGR